MPSCTSHMRRHTSSRNQRSCVTTTKAPAPREKRFLRCFANQLMATTSRWLVGSSSSNTSASAISTRARSTRRRWPPESVPTSAFQSKSPIMPSMMSRMRASDAHSYSGVSPTTFHPMDFASSNSSAWRREAKRTPPVRSTRPSSGSTVPSNKPKRDDLPSPLRPTTPTQSPSSTPRESDSKITFVGYSKCTFSQPNRKAIACCSFVRASPFSESHHMSISAFPLHPPPSGQL